MVIQWDLMGFNGDLMGFNGDLMGFIRIYDGIPSGYVKIAIENHHRNSGFTH